MALSSKYAQLIEWGNCSLRGKATKMKRESTVFEFKSRNKMEHDPPYTVGKNQLKTEDAGRLRQLRV